MNDQKTNDALAESLLNAGLGVERHKCENVREQPYRKPSGTNLTGTTWRKCGRVAILQAQTSKRWLCKECAAYFHIPPIITPNVI
jgi:hypothetical protein